MARLSHAGSVAAPILSRAVARDWVESYPEQAAHNLSLVALRRWGPPRENIGPVAVFLASDDSAYASG